MALPFAPPPDAARSANTLTCRCRDCTALRTFLAHPVEKVWSLKAAKASRAHLESQVRSAGCDVNTRTDTRGNPHTLICTKNQASYDVRVKQRAEDTVAVGRLD